ncbi:unnamed protein product [Brassica napus]|uniref:(rape) hypothetical protein n=1 Tax=Brassica napus TaxID=3708 RepID=A0A816K313_BRANA|nr:unnamed protein product [Brassica napus]
MGGGDGGDDSVVHFVFVHGASHGACVGISSPLFLPPPDSKPPLSTSPELASTSPTLTPST